MLSDRQKLAHREEWILSGTSSILDTVSDSYLRNILRDSKGSSIVPKSTSFGSVEDAIDELKELEENGLAEIDLTIPSNNSGNNQTIGRKIISVETTELGSLALDKYSLIDERITNENIQDVIAPLVDYKYSWKLLDLSTPPDPMSVREMNAEMEVSDTSIRNRLYNLEDRNILKEAEHMDYRETGNKAKLYDTTEIGSSIYQFGTAISWNLRPSYETANSDRENEEARDYSPDQVIEEDVTKLLEVAGQKHTLNIIRELHEPKTANDIAEQGIPIATVYRRLEKLEETNLIEQVGRPINENHRRIRKYEVTPRARSILQAVSSGNN